MNSRSYGGSSLLAYSGNRHQREGTADTVRETVETMAATLERHFPAVASMLRDAREEITAFADFPQRPTGARSGPPTRWSG